MTDPDWLDPDPFPPDHTLRDHEWPRPERHTVLGVLGTYAAMWLVAWLTVAVTAAAAWLLHLT